MLSDDLAAFVESGISVLVGTRDALLCPESSRAFGARVEPGREEVTVFMPPAFSTRSFENLRDNGRIAVCFSRPLDHRSIQLKGSVLEIRECGPGDRPVLERYARLAAQTFAEVGIPRRTMARLAFWPCRAVRFRVEALFVQTPGPGAGDPLGRAPGGRGEVPAAPGAAP
jgi:hypothetical protein